MTVRIRVIPCLDVADGRVVKGVNFVDLKDAGDPVEQAQAYDAAGADELCFLDISASHEGRGTLLDIVRRTAEVCFMPLTVGGGVRSVEDARALLLAGADKVAVNSAAVARPEVVSDIAARMGSQCVVASVDARWSHDHWEIFTHGGRRATGIGAVEHAVKLAELGAGELLVTSMDGDGTQRGYDLKLTRAIADSVSIPVVAILLWRFAYDPAANGLFNSLLRPLGIGPLAWLNDAALAMPSIVVQATWAAAGTSVLVYLAALTAVRPELYEAAALDGASVWGRVWHVTLPQMRTMILVMLLLQLIGAAQVFTEPFLMTSGGPQNATLTVLLLMYRYAFGGSADYGAATALGLLLALTLALLSAVYLRLTRRWQS